MHKFTEPMIATKRLKYNTRMMVAGDSFMAKGKDVRVLEALKRAERGRPPEPIAPPSAALRVKIAARFAPQSAKPADDDITAVRREYAEKMGKRPYSGWDIGTLREKMG